MKEHFEKAIQYVRENASWSKACEEYALEIIGKYRCPIDQASSEIAEEIRDLMEEYGVANDLPDGWWYEFGDEDSVFFKL